MMNEANTLDLDDLDEIQDLENDVVEEPINTEEPSTEPSNDFDLTKELLTLQGISDMNKIKFEDESGAVVEKSWDSLSNNEKLMILSHQEDPDTSLDASEIELINQIRESGMTPDQYIQSLSKEEQPQVTYEVDNMSDDELFCLDLLDIIGSDNITDEELETAINNAKQNEALFKKTVEGLRKEYIRLQQDEEAQQANELAAKQEAAYRNFATSINNEIRGLNSFAGQDLELSNEDSEELAAFMLDLDENGTSAFGRALQDPSLFTKAAFWLLNED